MSDAEKEGQTSIVSGSTDEDHAKHGKTGEGGDACRCKEASNMSPAELLKLMMSDLAFWKKGKDR